MGLVVDLFAGGGGASIGVAAALGRDVDVAVNHDEVAITVHRKNHPETKHYTEDVFEVDPLEATGGQPVDLLWASPDCTHHSRAKGDVPRDQKIRALADVIIPWARKTRPRFIFVENVPEFEGWGPLGKDGRPDKSRKGHFFQGWVNGLRQLGYRVEWQVLNCSEYGAPTKRMRLFIVARRDGGEVAWPEKTHGPGRAHELVPAWRCIDWSLPCPSIFMTKEEAHELYVQTGIKCKRPLVEKTMARIANGVRRYVLEAKDPFILRGHPAMVPMVAETRNGERPGQRPRIHDVRDTHRTVTAKGSQGALVAAFMAKHYGGVYGHGLKRPIGTVTGRDHHALAAASLVKFRGTSPSHIPAQPDIREPIDTISAGGNHVGEVRAFLTKYHGCPQETGQSLFDGMHTVTGADRFGLVTVEGEDYEIVDIGMRMLSPHELLAAQFGEFAKTYSFDVTKTDRFGRQVELGHADKVRLIGNSVPPHVVRALVQANCDDLFVKEMAA